ncbi:hypothetical protein [Cupriavidus necator]
MLSSSFLYANQAADLATIEAAKCVAEQTGYTIDPDDVYWVFSGMATSSVAGLL